MTEKSEHFSQRPTFGGIRQTPAGGNAIVVEHIEGDMVTLRSADLAKMREDMGSLEQDCAAFKARLNDPDVFRVPRLDLVEAVMPAEMIRPVFWGSLGFMVVALLIALYVGWAAFFAASFAAVGSHSLASVAKMAQLRKRIVEPYEPDPERRRGD